MARAHNKVRCNNCQRTILRDLETLNGCGCDPDAPTWIALYPDGRMLAMSHADWTDLT